MNNAMALGRFTRDPEVKFLQDGKAVCEFDIACKRPHSAETDFLKCVAWGKDAENIGKYFTKGKLISVAGYLVVKNWEKDGQKRSQVKINCNCWGFGGDAKPGSDTAENNQNSSNNSKDDPDLPF